MEDKITDVKLNNDKTGADEQTLHKFVDAYNGVSLERYKQALKYAAQNTVKQSDHNFAKGTEEVGKVVVPITKATTILAAKASVSDYKSHLNDRGKAGEKLDKAISEKKLTIEGLTDMSKKDLKRELKSLGFSKKERHLIIKNAEFYQKMFLFRDEMRGYVKGTKHEACVNSSDFFFMNKKESAKLLHLYMRRSKDDAIRNVSGWGNKSARSLKKFLKKADKNGVSEVGKHAVDMQSQLNKLRRGNKLASRIVHKNVVFAMYKFKRNVRESDDNGKIGAEKLAKAGGMTYVGYRVLIGRHKCGPVALPIRLGLKMALKTGAVTDRLCVKYNLFYRRTIGKAFGKGINVTNKGMVKAGSTVKKGAKAAGKYTVKTTKKVVDVAFSHRKTVKAKKKAQKKATEKAKKASRKKAANTASAAARKMGRGAKKAGKVTFTVADYGFLRPAKAIRNGIGKFFTIIEKLKYVLIATSMIILAVYILIALLFSITQAMENNSHMTSTAILGPEESSVYDKVIYLQGKLDERKSEAKKRGEGTPKTTSVAAGQTISKYGHPETAPDGTVTWTKGYKIYYKDSSGHLMADGTNNIKDVIILAYVGEDGEWEKANGLDTYIDKYWDYLNPDLTEDNLVETDIYCCADGCAEYTYNCNDSSAYDFISRINSEGGHVYSSIASQTSSGCKSRVVTKTGIRINSETKLPEVYSYEETEYYCDGHTAIVCYGHRDVEIQLETYFMQDAFDKDYMAGAIFEKLSSWESDEIDWCNSLYDTDWYDTYGIDPMGGYGFSVVGSYSAEEIAAMLEGLDVDDTRLQIVKNAISLVGKVPYYWGGKATEFSVYPFNTTAGGQVGTTVAPDEKGRTLAGLDCYGFVQYCYNSTVSGLLPTSTTAGIISQKGFGMKSISANELKPGDIGVFYKNGSGGHIGIFYGYDDNGSALWVHCTGMPRNNVVVSGCGFDTYYTIP